MCETKIIIVCSLHTNSRAELSLTEQVETDVEMDNAAILSDTGSSLFVPGLNKPFDPRAAADAQESMKAKLIANRKKLVEQVSTCFTTLEQFIQETQSFESTEGTYHQGELKCCL